MGSDIFNF